MDASPLQIPCCCLFITRFKIQTLFFINCTTFRYISPNGTTSMPAKFESGNSTTPRYLVNVQKQKNEYAISHIYFLQPVLEFRTFGHVVSLSSILSMRFNICRTVVPGSKQHQFSKRDSFEIHRLQLVMLTLSSYWDSTR